MSNEKSCINCLDYKTVNTCGVCDQTRDKWRPKKEKPSTTITTTSVNVPSVWVMPEKCVWSYVSNIEKYKAKCCDGVWKKEAFECFKFCPYCGKEIEIKKEKKKILVKGWVNVYRPMHSTNYNLGGTYETEEIALNNRADAAFGQPKYIEFEHEYE